MQNSHRFSLSRLYGRYTSQPANAVLSEAKQIARQANQVFCADHILLAISDHAGENWLQFLELLDDPLIESESIHAWINTHQPESVKTAEAVMREAYQALQQQQRHFCLNTGYLILGLLNLDEGFLAAFFRQNNLDRHSIRQAFQQRIRQEPLPFPLEDELLAFLQTQIIDVHLRDESADDAIYLTIPAITLIQELLATFRSSDSDEVREALIQTRNNQIIEIHIRSETPDK